jgi:hypothetical protein
MKQENDSWLDSQAMQNNTESWENSCEPLLTDRDCTPFFQHVHVIWVNEVVCKIPLILEVKPLYWISADQNVCTPCFYYRPMWSYLEGWGQGEVH